jgi:ketosteroid isomerase-like protein
MKKCTQIVKQQKTRFAAMATIAMLLVNIGCANLESDQTIEPSETSMDPTSSSTLEVLPESGQCLSVSQDISNRFQGYVAAFVEGETDKLYYDFWSPDYHEFTPAVDLDREGVRDQMIAFHEAGGKLVYSCELLDRNIYNDVAYDIASYDNDGDVSGTHFTINGYYFMRWVKDSDGVWHVDKDVNGPRGNTTAVDSTSQVSAVCYGQQAGHRGNDVTSREISDRFEAYKNALASGNANKINKFWTEDFHYYGDGLDANRDGLYLHYSDFFETGHIVSSNTKLSYRYMHGNVAYDIGYSDDTIIVNGVQSVKKSHYVIRWVKENDKKWRISRFMDLTRL